MKTDDINYYIPLTVNELIEGLQVIVKNSKDLTGQELIVGLEYVDEDPKYAVPPGSIAVFLQQNTLDPEEPKYGTIVLTPGKTRTLM